MKDKRAWIDGSLVEATTWKAAAAEVATTLWAIMTSSSSSSFSSSPQLSPIQVSSAPLRLSTKRKGHTSCTNFSLALDVLAQREPGDVAQGQRAGYGRIDIGSQP